VPRKQTYASKSFVDTFLQEAEDLLTEIDDAALALRGGETTEPIHRLFRAFHTIKGSSGMCGLAEVADFTHHIETMLDKVRSGEITATPKLADLVLAGRDQVHTIIQAQQAGQTVADGSSERLIARLHEFSGAESNGSESTASFGHDAPPAETHADGESQPAENTWEIHFRPDSAILEIGGNPMLLLRDLAELGACTVTANTADVPGLDEIDPTQCYLSWKILLTTTADENALRDIFLFVEDGAELAIKQLTVARDETESREADTASTDVPPTQALAVPQKTGEASGAKSVLKESMVRVPAGRLDRLVNLVGELVMNQSRITQIMSQQNVPELANPVQEIERLVAELRDDVLGIRMLPIGTLFSRFRRLVSDLSQELGKEIELIAEGGETELDKSILDQLGEPLIHLLRNSLDHGIENAETRVAHGKPAQGTIRLNALHTGSTVVVSIEDDGGGINRSKVRAKAIERQLISPDANLSDKEVLGLLMLPGFSTAQKVTSISGRGVGMDVVKRQIELLRGTILIASEEGKGTSISLTLPLTLAIIEGLLVQIGESRLIFPMSAVTENVELHAEERQRANGRNVIQVRGDLIPYIDLRALFDMDGEVPEIEKIVIVEHEGQRVGFVVDRVLGTHQTVLQPLGRFFRKVNVASGATIMGDGGVALIVDISSTIQLADRLAQAISRPAESKAA
jgi:two-component system chemotaxis sensor kinase CheA